MGFPDDSDVSFGFVRRASKLEDFSATTGFPLGSHAPTCQDRFTSVCYYSSKTRLDQASVGIRPSKEEASLPLIQIAS
jgi:hypothetical protein